MSYSLRLISQDKPDTPDAIHCSNHMIGWGVWSELSKLAHINLSYLRDSDGVQIASSPAVDFTLIHSYTPGPIFDHMAAIKNNTRKQVMWISEQPHKGMDHCFTFRPYTGCEDVPLPTLKEILDSTRLSKSPGSVLLDHAWGWEDDYKPAVDYNLWCNRLYEWLEGRQVAQMESPLSEQLAGITIPEWVQKIPNAYYLDYLRMTAPYENFVMTHPGTYEHSIIDMAYRGIRVLVPTPTVKHLHKAGWEIAAGGDPFAPQDTIDRLQLQTFSSREELLSILDTPVDEYNPEIFTDIAEVAAQIDRHCQSILGG